MRRSPRDGMRGPMHRRDLLLCLSKPANVSLSPMLAKVLDYPLECLNGNEMLSFLVFSVMLALSLLSLLLSLC